MFYSADARDERFWRVGIARNAVVFHSFAASKARKVSSEKRGGGSAAQDADKICTTLGHESDLEVKIAKNWQVRSTLGSWDPQQSKSLKHRGFGALLVEIRKILRNAVARERFGSQNPQNTRCSGFGISKCFSRGRRTDFDTLQNTWQVQEFVRVAKTLAGVVDLKGVRNDAFFFRGRRRDFVLCGVDALNPWKGCYTEMLLCRHHFAWQLQEFVCLGLTFSWQAQYFEAPTKKPWKCIGILRSTVWSTCHFLRKSRTKPSFLSFKISFLKEVSHKSFVFEYQLIFEGSLAKKFCFWAWKPYFWRKSRRKASFLSLKASFLIFTSIGSQIQTNWISHQVNLKSNDSQPNWISILNLITWISPGLNLKPFECQINCSSIRLNWNPSISNQ